MIHVPGNKPFVPPIAPKEAKKISEPQEEAVSKPVQPPKEGFVNAPQLDARAIAVRMAALAHEAKEKELSFDEIIEEAIRETGEPNAQAALEEANRKTQKEIEEILEQIKANKDLMEEAEAWEEFGRILEKELSQEQVAEFFGNINQSLRNL